MGDAATGPSTTALDLYMAGIRQLPPLPQQEVNELCSGMKAHEGRFRDALFEIPGTARLLFERWEYLRDEDRVTGQLAARFRDEPSRDWSGEVDAWMETLGALLAHWDEVCSADADPALLDAELRTALSSFEVDFDVLREVHGDLAALRGRRGRADAERRRALGLATRAARAALGRAGRALEERDTLRQRVVAHNLRLVVHVSKRHRRQGVAFQDLIQEGSLGLFRAVDKFDPERGHRFSTYAVWWIEQAVIRAIQRDSRTVRVPANRYDDRLQLRRVSERLENRAGEPSVTHIARGMERSEEEVEAIFHAFEPIGSLDATGDDPDATPLRDRIADGKSVDPVHCVDLASAREILEREMRGLSEREAAVLELRFGLGGREQLSLRAAGARLGLSGERVRQVQRRAIGKLRAHASIGVFREAFASQGEEA